MSDMGEVVVMTPTRFWCKYPASHGFYYSGPFQNRAEAEAELASIGDTHAVIVETAPGAGLRVIE